MSIPYHDIVASVALRINALADSTLPDELQTAFTTRPLTSANFDSSIFPFDDIKGAVKKAVATFKLAIANKGGHPWRNYPGLASVTDFVNNGGDLPGQDENGLSIIGVWGTVFDATDNRPLFEAPLEQIMRRNALTTIYLLEQYKFKIDDQKLWHTRPISRVKIKVCIYDGITEQEAIDNNDDMTLPDVLEPAVMSAAIGMLVRDDEFMGQAGMYAQYAGAWLDAIGSGLMSVVSKAIPGPSVEKAA
jgi:hypothetical protein